MLYKNQLKIYLEYFFKPLNVPFNIAQAQFHFETLSGENRLSDNDWHLICITYTAKTRSVEVRVFYFFECCDLDLLICHVD